MSSSNDDFTSASDSELVKLAKTGNADAFAELFERYKRPVRGYLAGLVGNREDGDDFTQRAFLNAWDKILTLHDESRFKPWIFTIARNLAYDNRRLQARSPSQSLESLNEPNDPVNEINLEDEIAVKELVKLAMAELPPKYRDCLLLLIQGGFSRDEIAEFLKISNTSVSTYICTARKLFRQAYYRLKHDVDATEKRRAVPMNEQMLTPCPEWEEKLAGFDREDLSPSEREALNSHLLSCSACAAALADYQRMDLLIDQAFTSNLPLELPEDFAASRQHDVTETHYVAQKEGDNALLREAEMIVEQVQFQQDLGEHEHREGFQAHPSGHLAIANCRLKRIVDKDNFTSLYLGEHVHLNKRVVIKLHHRRLSNKEKQSFHKQAELIAGLRHPNIINILEYGIHEEKPFLVMDHAPFGSLRQRHPRGIPVPLPTIVNYVKVIADALQYAHDKKIMHRNIRPENILLGPDDQILLADFGISVLQPNISSLTHTATGAHFYMAPEQFQGEHYAASDQYALAVMVYEWLSGERPFYGSAIEIAIKHRDFPPPPLHQKVPTLSPAVERVVLKALAKTHEMRFKRVQEFATALEEASAN